MGPPQPVISPDGQWWWDGRQWMPLGLRDARAAPFPAPAVIPIHRRVPLKYARDVEPPEIRARFGSILFAMGFFLTLPAMGTGTIFSMAIVTGQDPPWPTAGEGVFLFAVVLGLVGIWPLVGLLYGFGIRDGLRWVLLCLACSGAAPAIVLGGIMVIGARDAPASDLVEMEAALAWMWGLPALGLAWMRATGTGRPLPRLVNFLRMFGRSWREQLPGPQTQEAQIVASARYPLSVPGADFALPPEAAGAIHAIPGPVRVTYDLQQGRIETIEAGG
jgi:hypothetical protein